MRRISERPIPVDRPSPPALNKRDSLTHLRPDQRSFLEKTGLVETFLAKTKDLETAPEAQSVFEGMAADRTIPASEVAPRSSKTAIGYVFAGELGTLPIYDN